MANQDRVNFVWAESALTTIPPIPVSEVAYRDTTQTPEQMEVGQQYDTIYNSARHNQLLFLLTSVAKTLCENGIMPFLAGQEYSQYARCIFTDGKLYTASRAILAKEQPYPTPGDNSGVWIAEETNEHLVPNSRRVIAGKGLTGGGPLSSDVTLAAKLDEKTTQAAADGAITVKDVAIGGNASDLASARGIFDTLTKKGSVDCNKLTNQGVYAISLAETANGPGFSAKLIVFNEKNSKVTNQMALAIGAGTSGAVRVAYRARDSKGIWSTWSEGILSGRIGDGLTVNNGIISVPEYEGATAAAAGTSGLVPPAAAGQQESFLTGGGEYKPALGFTPVQQGGGTGQGRDKIYIGYSKSGLKAQAGTHDLGNVVTTSAGCTKAPSAEKAHGLVVTADGQTAVFNWAGRPTGQPEWVWGGNAAEFGNMYTWNPLNFNVNYATSSNNAWQTTVVPNVAFVGRNGAIPNGGTWLYIYVPYDNHYLRSVALAGGAATPSNDGGIAIRIS